MIQIDLFPIRVVSCEPSDLNTADCKNICLAEDGTDYAVKTIHDHPLIPASEWFCYHIASICGIATPVCKQLTMPDGTMVFGSRWEGGIYDLSDPTMFVKLIMGIQPTSTLAERLSAIYTLDLFLHNVDRHARNYLFRQSKNGFVALAFDFSRSWLYHGWPPPDVPMQRSTHTRTTYQTIRKFHPFNINAGISVLGKIRHIPTDTISSIINSMPPTWLSPPHRQDVLKWWDSTARHGRVDRLLEGLQDGSYI